MAESYKIDKQPEGVQTSGSELEPSLIKVSNPLDPLVTVQHHSLLLVANNTDTLSKFKDSFESDDAFAAYIRSLAVVDGTYQCEFGEFAVLINTMCTADYQVSNVEINSIMIDPTKPLYTGDISFHIKEPKSMFWMEKIRMAELNLAISQGNLKYMFVMIAVGTDENGMPVIFSAAPMYVIATDINLEYTHNGSEYHFNGIFSSTFNLDSKQAGQVYNLSQAITIRSDDNGSIGSLIQDLQNQLNEIAKQTYDNVKKETGKGSKVQYLITLPKEWQNYTIATRVADNQTEGTAGNTPADNQTAENANQANDCNCEVNQNRPEPVARPHDIWQVDKIDASPKVDTSSSYMSRIFADRTLRPIKVATASDAENNKNCPPCETKTETKEEVKSEDFGASAFRYMSGSSVSNIIEDVLTKSKQITEKFTIKMSDFKKNQTKTKFSILNSVTSGDTTTIRYDIVLYKYPMNLKNQDFSAYYIEYDYLFTGANLDVLDFSLKMNATDTLAYIMTSADDFSKSSNDYTKLIQDQTNNAIADTDKIGQYNNSIEPTLPIRENDPITPAMKLSASAKPSLTADQNVSKINFVRSITTALASDKLQCKIRVRGNYALLRMITPPSFKHVNPTNQKSVNDDLKYLEDNVYNQPGQSNEFLAFTAPLLVGLNIYVPVSSDNEIKTTYVITSETGDRYKFWYDGYWQVIGVKTTLDGNQLYHELDMISYVGESADII